MSANIDITKILLEGALKMGDVEKAETLYLNFLDSSNNNNHNKMFLFGRCLVVVCSKGHVNSLKWLEVTTENIEKSTFDTSFGLAIQNEKIEVCEWFRENFPLQDWMEKDYLFYEHDPLFCLAHEFLRTAISYGKLESVIWLFQHFKFFNHHISQREFIRHRDRDSDILWAFENGHFDIVRFFLTHEDYPKEHFEILINMIEDKEDEEKMRELFEPIGLNTKPVKM
jgi:hypothetical protein